MTESDVPGPRLQLLSAGMSSIRAITNGLRDEIISISKNVSVLSNLTKYSEPLELDGERVLQSIYLSAEIWIGAVAIWPRNRILIEQLPL